VTRSLLLIVSCLLLAGCAAAVGESANIAKDEVVLRDNLQAAYRGDAVAQYKVGDALCCSLNEGSGFYNTRKAVGWLCASAVQGYVPAMYKLGKIYSGDVIDGVRLARRVAQGVAGNSENHPVAYNWLVQAAARGEDDALPRANELWKGMSAAEQAETRRQVDAGLGGSCRWEDAILGKR